MGVTQASFAALASLRSSQPVMINLNGFD